MKVGTDGVLLGAWCGLRPGKDKSILDIGTGTGVIALQLAQRTERWNGMVEAVEIDPAACETARRNFDASPWSGRLKLHPVAVQEFACPGGTDLGESSADTEPGICELPPGFIYDHIVSNPPYFTDSLTSPDLSKTTARHTVSLSFGELIAACDRLLKPDGRISLILPAGAEAEKMIAIADGAEFAVSRLTEVHSTPRSGPKRLLIEFCRRSAISAGEQPDVPETSSLVIEDAGPGTFSAGYRALTRDFYLYF